MSQQRVERKLAAILAADVAGYSRLMGADEEGTARALREHRAAINPIVALHGGRIVRTIGDGFLLEFPSIVAAVECAMAVQRLMAERNVEEERDRRMLFRIGINLGDVLTGDDDIVDDGVNIAARLEGLAGPGGICISESSYQQVRDKVATRFEDMGEHQLKNIVRPVRVYRVLLGGTPEKEAPRLALPDKPSIAVLPFHNTSDDPQQEYFADGIVEEIITALSRFRSLFVIARNSSFTYKGRAVDVKQVGRELGARYVLEGSVYKAANRVRITGQLIDTLTGVHLWADRFKGTVGDIFDLQDKVTASVVGAIAPTVEQAEIERAKRKPTESLVAYDYFLRGMASIYQYASREAIAEALRLFSRAIELDPEYSSAYAMAAFCYMLRKSSGWMADPANENAETARLALQAIKLGQDDAVALAAGGWALAHVLRNLDTSVALIDRALMLNPNLAAAWHYAGWVKIWLGDPDSAIECLAQAMRLNPLGPYMPRLQSAMAHAHFVAGHDHEASSWAAAALREDPNLQPGLRVSAASNALEGRLEPAQQAVARLRQLNPALRVSTLREVLGPHRRPEDLARYEEGLRKAGLPE